VSGIVSEPPLECVGDEPSVLVLPSTLCPQVRAGVDDVTQFVVTRFDTHNVDHIVVLPRLLRDMEIDNRPALEHDSQHVTTPVCCMMMVIRVGLYFGGGYPRPGSLSKYRQFSTQVTNLILGVLLTVSSPTNRLYHLSFLRSVSLPADHYPSAFLAVLRSTGGRIHYGLGNRHYALSHDPFRDDHRS